MFDGICPTAQTLAKRPLKSTLPKVVRFQLRPDPLAD
jgi:hypothetical protein